MVDFLFVIYIWKLYNFDVSNIKYSWLYRTMDLNEYESKMYKPR